MPSEDSTGLDSPGGERREARSTTTHRAPNARLCFRPCKGRFAGYPLLRIGKLVDLSPSRLSGQYPSGYLTPAGTAAALVRGEREILFLWVIENVTIQPSNRFATACLSSPVKIFIRIRIASPASSFDAEGLLSWHTEDIASSPLSFMPATLMIPEPCFSVLLRRVSLSGPLQYLIRRLVREIGGTLTNNPGTCDPRLVLIYPSVHQCLCCHHFSAALGS